MTPALRVADRSRPPEVEWARRIDDGAAAVPHLLRERMTGLRFATGDGASVASPVFLTRLEVDELESTSQRVADLITQVACTAAGEEPRRLAQLARFDNHLLAPMIGGAPSWRLASSILRPDVVFSNGVPTVLELNFNSVLSGSVETTVLTAAFAEAASTHALPFEPEVPETFQHARGRLADRIARARSAGGRPKVLLVGSVLDRFKGFSRFLDEEARYLEHEGLDVDICDVGEVGAAGRNLTLHGRDADVAFRLYNTELLVHHGYSQGRLAELEATPDTSFVSTSECLLFSSNALLALAHEMSPRLEDGERTLLRRHVPWTAILREGRASRRDEEIDLVPFTLAHRDTLVLKPLHGHYGINVVLGTQVDAAGWEAAVEAAVLDGHFCVQELAVPDAFPVALYDGVSGATEVAELSCVFGPYRVGGGPAGIAVRHLGPGSATDTINWCDRVLFNVALPAP